ncbi:Transcription factor BOA15 [Cladobotryum mycophilum]|uniref:Transcription factor BOA15 n=1 Tax=Cladobotryum mycophilum TaxID=491253 RepID=A0ABR0SIP7_9HYPO
MSRSFRVCNYPQRRKRREHRKATSESVSPLIQDTATEQSSSPQDRRENEYYRVPPEPTGANILAESFLDPEVFNRAQLETPRGNLDEVITKQVSDLVGSVLDIKATSKAFFDTVHAWMPIISRIQFSKTLLNRLSYRRAELYLLILSMRLCCSRVTTARTLLYRTTKQLHFEIEGLGAPSLPVLQASVLIALYELGHAIYPAASLSVAHCARYATALGIDKTVTAKGIAGLEWIEEEERRRVWWSILTLDRFTNLYDTQHHLVTPDPDSGSFLPVDDQAWNAGTSRPEDSFPLGSANILLMGRFARFAQGAHLLSQVLHHIAEQSSDTTQLRRTMLALVNLSNMEAHMRRLEFCTQTAVCYSGILLLEHPHVFRDDGIVEELSPEAALISEKFLEMAAHISQRSESEIFDLVSPFLLHLVYKLASMHLRASHINHSSSDASKVDTLKQQLKILGGRWLAAHTYLSLLERQEMLLVIQQHEELHVLHG